MRKLRMSQNPNGPAAKNVTVIGAVPGRDAGTLQPIAAGPTTADWNDWIADEIVQALSDRECNKQARERQPRAARDALLSIAPRAPSRRCSRRFKATAASATRSRWSMPTCAPRAGPQAWARLGDPLTQKPKNNPMQRSRVGPE
jgi:hypothetical protein